LVIKAIIISVPSGTFKVDSFDVGSLV
jgi:hypothetical protein